MSDTTWQWSEARERYEPSDWTPPEETGPFRLPKPGEHHNNSSIPVSDSELAALLSLAQQGMALADCRVEDCEDCNDHRLIWWDCCNALERSTRIALQAWLTTEGYGLPDTPWEDVEPDGTPCPRGYVGPCA